jgi:arylsulfatase A-like enzyme
MIDILPSWTALRVFLFSVWCGLAAGLLEVGARVASAAVVKSGRLYPLSRHFIWAGPLSNLLLFSAIGFLLALLTRLSPRQGGWLSPRLACALLLVPALMATVPDVYPEAWFLLAFGTSVQVVGRLGQFAPTVGRWLWWSFPVMVGTVAVLAGSVFLGDWGKERREQGRPLPSDGLPNVLLIVMDTVRADHLSCYGYERPTTPNLDRLARRGIRFEEVRAAAPWTLPSHASMFTGRVPHELVTAWLTPLEGHFPTLAEYLGSCGYQTAGFVANVAYCSYATGLDRGFTHYEDHVLENLAGLRTAGLVDRAFRTFTQLSAGIKFGPMSQARDAVNRWFVADNRKSAAAVNGSFLEWLSHQPTASARPFFVFLNYLDAHAAYIPPTGATHRFGIAPRTPSEKEVVYHAWPQLDKTNLPPRTVALGRDSYDDCLGYIDDQIGRLLAELKERGVLEQTLVIVTSDHGEAFGEHQLFDHGKSLYRTEIRVPLVIVPPGRAADGGLVVHRTVGLQDLAATITDLIGLSAQSPLSGKSLLPLWRDQHSAAALNAQSVVVSELASPNPINANSKLSPAARGPICSVAEGDFVYIRNEKDGAEELFNIQDDPRELSNRAPNAAFHTTLERFRGYYHESRRPLTTHRRLAAW